MTRRGLILFAVMSMVWGIPYLMIHVAVSEVTPAAFVFFRTLIGTAILLPVAVVRVDLRPTLRRLPWVAAFAGVEIAIPWVMLGSAEQHVSSSLAGLLIAGVPLAATVIGLLTGSAEWMGRTSLAGLLVGLVGVAAIVGADYQASGPVPLLQIGVVVIGYALGPAILARRLAGYPSLAVMGLSLGICAVIYLPVSLAAGWPAALPSAEVAVSVVLLGVICTAAAFLLFAALIDEIGAVRATVITYVNPAVAAILGVVLLGEAFTLPMTIGFALVIIGSGLATRPSTRALPRAPAAPVPVEPT